MVLTCDTIGYITPDDTVYYISPSQQNSNQKTYNHNEIYRTKEEQKSVIT